MYVKVLLIKNRNFNLLSEALGENHPPIFPKTGPFANRHPFPQPYLAYPSGSPSKGALSPYSPHSSPTEGQTLHFLSPPIVHLSKSLVNAPPPGPPAGQVTDHCNCTHRKQPALRSVCRTYPAVSLKAVGAT